MFSHYIPFKDRKCERDRKTETEIDKYRELEEIIIAEKLPKIIFSY